MSLTGRPGRAPLAPDGPVIANLERTVGEIAALTAELGARVDVDLPVALSGRAALHGFERRGAVSANGSCRLLRGPRGWVAINLARPADRDAVAAIAPGGRAGEDPWEALERAVARDDEVVGRARLLGVAAAAVPSRAVPRTPSGGAAAGEQPMPAGEPWKATRISGGSPRQPLAGGRVVDLSALWAGPLCARILGRAGMEVIKVESPTRPDGARLGSSTWWAWLHAGQREVSVDLTRPAGRAAGRELLESADVVIEGSRPRALHQLGLAAGDLDLRPGCTWLSITGHGRRGEAGTWTAFGDDAAAGGGLVAWDNDGPVFCGDALADPVTGLIGALAVLGRLAAGGGALIDLAMRDAAAAVLTGPALASPPDACAHAVVEPGAPGWIVRCEHGAAPVVAPVAPRAPWG